MSTNRFVQWYTESNRHGTNILVVKGTAHTRLKEIRAKATVIALASFDVGRLKKSLEEENQRFSRFLAVSLAMRFSHLGGYHSVEKRWNRIAKCPEWLTTRAFATLEGFRMYTHYGCVGAIPT